MTGLIVVIRTVKRWSPHNPLYLLDVDQGTACWRPPAPRVMFYLIAPLFEHLVPLKNTCVWHGAISIFSLKHCNSLWWCFSQPEQKFQVHSFLIACSWTIKKKKRVVNKSMWKHCNVFQKINLQLHTLKISVSVVTKSAYPFLANRSHRHVTFQKDLVFHFKIAD